MKTSVWCLLYGLIAFWAGCVACWLTGNLLVKATTPGPQGALLSGTAGSSLSALFASASTAPVPSALFASASTAPVPSAAFGSPDSETSAGAASSSEEITREWPQWCGTPVRNNVAVGRGIPDEWEVGDFDRKTGAWMGKDAKNVKWVARVGSQTYGNPTVAGGRLFVGTNNGAGYLKRYPDTIDLGCLLAFDIRDGHFLWQHSSEKLPSGRVHDWPLQGICCAPLVEGNRMWFVSSRGEVLCLDAEGYYDNEDDGPRTASWGNLFREPPTATAGLEQNLVPPVLEAVLRQAGVALTGRVRVDAIDDNAWTITVQAAPGQTGESVKIRSDSGKVTCERIQPSAAEASTGSASPLLEFPLDLTTGLSEGKLHPALRALAAARGLPIDEVESIKPDGAAAWVLNVTSGQVARKLRFVREGPNLAAYKWITPDDKDEADEIWVLDMMGELGVSQHNMCSCSVTSYGDILVVITSNGVDESHIVIPNINAPSFLALNKHTGEVYWTDASPGANIVHGQWSSPTVAVIQGVPQVLFAGGDGWVYSFRADEGRNGKPELLWKFDANSKTAKFELGGRGTRNDIIATPVVYKDRVYVVVGQDPEHGEGEGQMWCIDPTKRGDISAELAVSVRDRSQPIPHKRLQAVVEADGEIAIDNPNSGVIWQYRQFDQDGDGEAGFEECMHRGIGSPAIKDDILVVADLSGIVHCVDALTGKVHWTHDMLAQSWGTPLIVEGKIYLGDEDGELSVFALDDSSNEPISVIDMRNSIYSTPIVASNVLYVANRTHIFAVEKAP